MAIANNTGSGGIVGGGTGTLTLANTVAGSNTILFVGIANQNVNGLTSVKYAGVDMTLIDSQTVGVTIVYLYYLLAPTTGANNVVVIRSGTTNSLYVQAISYSGAKQSGVPDASTKAGVSGGTTMTGTLTTIANNCWTVMAAYDGNSQLTVGTGSTFRGSDSTSPYTAAIFDSNAAITPAGSTSMTVGATAATNKQYVMASFAPAPVSANGNFLMFM